MVRVFWVAAVLIGILASVPAHASPSPAGFSVALGVQYRTGALLRDWLAFLSVAVPLDRLAAPRRIDVEHGFAEEPPKKETEPSAASSTPAKPSDRSQLTLSPRLARDAVHRALAVAGYYAARSRLSSLGARARRSAALPELRLRALRSAGQTLRLTPTTDDPYRYTQAGTSELLFEARLTWSLDRLVFADQEVSLERLQSDRDAAERRLIELVLARLSVWQRSRVRAADPDRDPEARETAELEALDAVVELDVLTDGWFSKAIGDEDAAAALTRE